MSSFSPSSPDYTAPEVERLLNPAYCAHVLATFAASYSRVRPHLPAKPLVYPLIHLCLPMVLHGPTRDEITAHRASYSLHRLVRRRPEVLVGLPMRIEGFSAITRHSLIFGIQQGLLSLDKEMGTVASLQQGTARASTHGEFADEAIRPIKAADLLGGWMSYVTTAQVFLHLGLQPA